MGPRINDRIRVREVRVVDEGGEPLGVMTPREALDIARAKGMDLIEVAPTAVPPVCRIMDYGKFKYEQGKREREARQKQRHSEMKGITISPALGFIDDHDLEIKIKNVIKFLGEGDKVKITFRFRSRWMAHPEFAHEAMQKIVKASTDAGVGQVERHPVVEGRQMIMILNPSKEAAKRAAQKLESRNEGNNRGDNSPRPKLIQTIEAPQESEATAQDEEEEDEDEDELLDEESAAELDAQEEETPEAAEVNTAEASKEDSAS